MPIKKYSETVAVIPISATVCVRLLHDTISQQKRGYRHFHSSCEC